ncbi:MAG TPA: polymer-forming cytoskeletal protein [Anaerolineae bacterium]|nr:polymer-forming cytoskeletal protein [Anaerolineae bacterium]
MFRKSSKTKPPKAAPIERITSVLGPGISWRGKLSGKGGLRIEGSFEGEIGLNGMLVVGETGRVTCQEVRANTVIVAGAVRGNITAEKLEIRSTGRVWGNVTTMNFSTEEGAFLRGKVTMEEKVKLDFKEEKEEQEKSAQPAKNDQGQAETKS